MKNIDKEEVIKLFDEVAKFKSWAAKNYPECNENNDNGEWELSGDSACNFNEMRDVASNVLASIACQDSNDELIDNMLYIIARDNEEEILADEVIKSPGWFKILIEKSLESEYYNAMWQLVKRLAVCETCEKHLLFRFLESNDEYTSRMALQVLPEIFPEKAEEYAIEFWNRNKYSKNSAEDECQKIMVLYVLKKINSPKLKEYLDKSLKTDYKYLIQNAEAILSNMR